MAIGGRGRNTENARARVVVLAFSALAPALETLPQGDPIRVDFLAPMLKHGSQYGLSLSRSVASRGTLMDAKEEILERIDELELTPFMDDISDADFNYLAQGTTIRLDELRLVLQSARGALSRMEGVSRQQLAAGMMACGILYGALARGWRY